MIKSRFKHIIISLLGLIIYLVPLISRNTFNGAMAKQTLIVGVCLFVAGIFSAFKELLPQNQINTPDPNNYTETVLKAAVYTNTIHMVVLAILTILLFYFNHYVYSAIMGIILAIRPLIFIIRQNLYHYIIKK